MAKKAGLDAQPNSLGTRTSVVCVEEPDLHKLLMPGQDAGCMTRSATGAYARRGGYLACGCMTSMHGGEHYAIVMQVQPRGVTGCQMHPSRRRMTSGIYCIPAVDFRVGLFTLDANERTANRLLLAAKDMEDAKRYLNAFEELSQAQVERGTSEYFDHCEGIMIAAIVAYCRSFKRSQTDGNADPLIDPDSLALFSGRPELDELHNQLIERRDKAVAHADWEYHKIFLVSRNYKGGVLRRSPIPNLTGDISTGAFRELVEHVSQECLRRGFDLDREARDAEP